MTKNEILFSINAVARFGDSLSELDGGLRSAVQAERVKFQAGTATKTSVADLETLLDSLAETCGSEEAQRRVELARSMDLLTEAGQNDGDFTKTFGKEVVRAWLLDGRVTDKPISSKASAKTLDALVKSYKESTWEDEPPHIENAKRTAELEAAAKRAAAAKAQASSASAPSAQRAAAPSKALALTEPVAVQCGKRGGEVSTGMLQLDATVVGEDGTVYSSASKFARTVLGMQSANGWLLVTYLDGDVRKPVDALRVNSKGYGLGSNGSTGRGRKPKAIVGVEGAAGEVARMRSRVDVLADSLARAQANLAAAETALKEAQEQEQESGADDPDGTGCALEEEEVCTGDLAPDRATELQEMKVKALRALAATLKVQNRSKLPAAELVVAIMAAEAAA